MPFKNPIKDSIPCFLFTDAIYRGKEMTDISDGVRGTAPLKKCMIF